MNIQEHLAAFDGWLTSRIEDAYAARKDLAFRDLPPADGAGAATAWECSLLNPGQRAPEGEGWSVYRLQGVWPEFPVGAEPPPAALGERGAVVTDLAEALFGEKSAAADS
jgi:hypothetical protein